MANKLDPLKLTTGLKRDLIKDSGRVNPDLVEVAVKNIHAADEKKKDLGSKSTKRITLDIDKLLHKKIVWHVLEMDMTMKDYFIRLARKDLGIE